MMERHAVRKEHYGVWLVELKTMNPPKQHQDATVKNKLRYEFWRYDGYSYKCQ